MSSAVPVDDFLIFDGFIYIIFDLTYLFVFYRDLYAWEATRKLAIEAYEKVKDQWMYVCAYTVGKDLHLVQ